MQTSYKKVIGITGVTLAVYFVMKYLLVYVAPFLVAFLLVRLFYPVAVRLEGKLHIKKDWIVLFFLILLLSIAMLSFWFLGSRLFAQIRTAACHLDMYERKMEQCLDSCCILMEKSFGIDRNLLQDVVARNLTQLSRKAESINITVFVQNSIRYVSVFLKGLGIFFVIFVAVLLLVKDYEEIRKKLSAYVIWERAVHVGNRLWELAGKWLRAQSIIMLLVMAECVIGLWILKNSYALLFGILIGFLDALPFVGTGTILLPWAGIWLVRGDFFHAAAYATLFLIANSTREYLEPRLLGRHLGIYPIVLAVVVYAGVCIFGMAGVLLGPITLLSIVEISKEIWYDGGNR